MLHSIYGSPKPLGVITSPDATARNNATTATPFQVGRGGLIGPGVQMLDTLAGKVLLLVAQGAGVWLANESAALNVAPLSLPIAPGTVPGVPIADGERVQVTMMPTEGWLQWLPLAGGSLFVWELR